LPLCHKKAATAAYAEKLHELMGFFWYLTTVAEGKSS
jgi:hypothetical protein